MIVGPPDYAVPAAGQSPPMPRYTGRFAPSPTGPLHAGSLVAALASWLDARAHRGRWLVRIEDVDRARTLPGAAATILAQLAGCGLWPDEPPLVQTAREAAHLDAVQRLLDAGAAYHCGCSRRDIDDALAAAGTPHRRGGERIYPGTCRDGLRGRVARAVRLRTCAADGSDVTIAWHDRRLGEQRQNVTREVGDFVLRRADGCIAYQLAVVVDDAFQRVTDVVRGEDLADNTPRQIQLQRALGLPAPRYLHTPLVLAADGRKLSKQNGAVALAPGPAALRSALSALGLPSDAAALADLLGVGVRAWDDLHCKTR